MREFDVLDAIREGVTAYAGATAMFQADPRRMGWQDQDIPFIVFNVVSKTPDPAQSGALRYQDWHKVDDDSDGVYSYKIETRYRHQPHVLLSINCYGGFSEEEKTAEYVAQRVREWFLGVGHLALDQVYARTYAVGQVRPMPGEFNSREDALSRRELDVELVVAKGFVNRIESIEKVIVKPTIAASEEDEGQEWPYSSILTDEYIEPS